VSHPARRRTPRLIAALVVLLWIGVVGGVAGPFAGKLSEVQQNDNTSFLPASAEATEALELQGGFRDPDLLPTVVVYERQGGLTPADMAQIAEDAAAMAGIEGLLGEPSPPIPSEDGEAAQVFLPLDGSDTDAVPDVIAELRALTDSDGGLDAYVAGVGGLNADLFAAFGDIDRTLILATATVVVVILLVVYRSPFLWVLPLVSVALAFSLAAFVIYLLAREEVLTLSGQSQGILTVLVFGAGTDYALLLIARYREELHVHDAPADAMRVALRGAAPAIAASAATVVLGLLCLLASDLNSNRSLGPVAALGIVAALLAMTTLLPALLVVVGRRVFWPRIPQRTGSFDDSGVWQRVSTTVGRRPRGVALLTGGGLVVLALFATQLSADGLSQEEIFTSKPESVLGQEALRRHFDAGSGLPLVVIGSAEALPELTQVLEADDEVASVTPESRAPGGPPLVVDGRVSLSTTLTVPGDGAQAKAAVTRLRESVDAADPSAVVGGFTAVDLDVQTAAQRDNRVIIPLVLLVILLVLGLLLRAVVAPLMLVATVVLSYFATLGVCALVFENVFGWAGADSSFPLYAFVFLVALGIDYNIFLMTRVREETVRLGTREGVLKGLAVTGGVITSAGVVLAGTFAVLGILPIVFLAELGFAVAFGVLLDTLIVRSLLVPALTLQLGDRTWWPSALSRPDGAGQVSSTLVSTGVSPSRSTR
jgi:RND superfamily putative drug exporter